MGWSRISEDFTSDEDLEIRRTRVGCRVRGAGLAGGTVVVGTFTQ